MIFWKGFGVQDFDLTKIKCLEACTVHHVNSVVLKAHALLLTGLYY